MTGPAALPAAEVHLWQGTVGHGAGDHDGGPRPPASDLAILSDSERARCERFVRDADRVRFAVAHAAVRRVLAGYLGVEPAQIRFGRTPCCGCGSAEHGPPRIDWPVTDVTFNLSGSGDVWVLAVSRGRPLGVDIEVPRDVNVGELGPACLTAAEQDYLAAAPEADRKRLFYRCWTRKEAVLKACGLGLAGPMRELDTEPGQDGPAEIGHACPAGPSRWLVQSLPGRAGPDWIGAIAQPAEGAGQISRRGPADIGRLHGGPWPAPGLRHAE